MVKCTYLAVVVYIWMQLFSAGRAFAPAGKSPPAALEHQGIIEVFYWTSQRFAASATRRPKISPVSLSAALGATSGGSLPAWAITPL